MNRHKFRTARWWWVYGCAAVAAAGALAWVSVVMLRLERDEAAARQTARHQESVRLALWRMDSWLAPRLAREAARPYFEYAPYFPQERAYTRMLNEIEPGEILTPSPLLTYRSELFRLHFQFGADGELTSPQAPTGNHRDLAEATLLPDPAIPRNLALLEQIGGLVTVERIRGRLATIEAESGWAGLASSSWDEAAAGEEQMRGAAPAAQQQWAMSKAEATRRAQNVSEAQDAGDAVGNVAPLIDPPSAAIVTVGPLTPLWLRDGAGECELFFVRPVQAGEVELYQGMWADWPRLRSELLGQVNDLFDAAELHPFADDGPAIDQSRHLAAIPAALILPEITLADVAMITPARAILLTVWAAVTMAILAVGLMLRSSIDYGRRRSRFASAVTHELRTPLTTFRMYCEMLADGMVRDESLRREYLNTLAAESSRLARLVESVLTYARVEEGRAVISPKRLTVAALLDAVVPPLRQRAEAAGMPLEVLAPEHTGLRLNVDSDAVGQILFNLVDNACKYAADARQRTVHLETAVVGDRLEVCVRDHGPGVPQDQAKAVFAPFDRGVRQAGDSTPGVGLGLALSSQLARELGGTLKLDEYVGDGACFRLALPLSCE